MTRRKTKKPEKAYFSAEFQPKIPGIFYQFKLRKHDSEPMFAVVRKGSMVLGCIKTGDIIPMTYHFQDRTFPAEKRATRIKYISDGNAMGYKDHFIIGLDIDSDSVETNQGAGIILQIQRA